MPCGLRQMTRAFALTVPILLTYAHMGYASENGRLYVYLDIPGMNSLKDAEVSIDNTVRSFACHWRSATTFVCSQTPFGLYSLHVTAPGFRRVTAAVRIYSREVSIRVRLSVDGLDSGRVSKLSGRITAGDTAPANLWVRIMPIEEGPTAMDALVRMPEGKFEINGFDIGTYVFSLTESDGNRVLCAHPVELSIHTEVQVALNGGNCELRETQMK
jgi:hypothetical protein